MKTFVSLLLSVLIVGLVYVSSKQSNSSSARQDKAITQHDPNNIGAINVSGTPGTADADRWMLAYAGATPRTFHYNNNIALQYRDGTSPCVGEGYKIVNGICERGTKEWTGSSHAGTRYYCYYHYVFSDGTTSGTYTVSSNFPCFTPND
ncbi:hypothetical protein [Chitinophaga varians]|uniref:hypothetical protein n=1 Tax=Chitinophaga varians TaxID=2202339 RepID=UPI00165FD520|nr:hypothetical protein [Chitinophaga varians]MBC9913918.1 hypothetical protein [Chitinophaga varians]